MSSHNALLLCGLVAIYGAIGAVVSTVGVLIAAEDNKDWWVTRFVTALCVFVGLLILAGVAAATIGVLGEWT